MTSVGSIENLNEAEGLEIVACPTTTTKEKHEKPHVGMVFSSIQEAEVVYQDYGRENGFVIRRRSTYKAQRGRRITRVLFTCSCEGLHKKKGSLDGEGKTKKIRSTMRTNCKAMMRIICDRETDEWVVNDFFDDHNHVMVTPAKRVLMGSHKHVPHSIMTRWMKDANRNEVIATDDLPMHDRLVGSEAMRISHICRRSTQLAYLAGRSEEAYKVAMDFLDQAFEKVKQLDNTAVECENVDEPSHETCKSANDVVLSVQPISQTKGRKRVKKGKDKELAIASSIGQSKSGIEISEGSKRPRHCKTCSGHGHDSRNCKEKDKSKGDDSNDADLPKNGVEGIQTTKDLPKNGVEGIQTAEDLPKLGVEGIQTTKDLPKNGVEGIQITEYLPGNGVEGIQATADLPVNGVEGIQTIEGVVSNTSKESLQSCL